jgi:hypothetical protein
VCRAGPDLQLLGPRGSQNVEAPATNLDYDIYFLFVFLIIGRRDSSVGIAGTTGWTAGVRLPARASDFSLLHSVQNGSGSHPVSNPMATGGSFPGGKADGATHLYLVPRLRMVGLYHHSPI